MSTHVLQTTKVVKAGILVAATMRLTRLIVADDLPGQWWIKDPLERKAADILQKTGKEPRWARYIEGTSCPFCVGLWIAGGVVAAEQVWSESRWWRMLTTALALNEVAAHLGARLGDTAD